MRIPADYDDCFCTPRNPVYGCTTHDWTMVTAIGFCAVAWSPATHGFDVEGEHVCALLRGHGGDHLCPCGERSPAGRR